MSGKVGAHVPPADNAAAMILGLHHPASSRRPVICVELTTAIKIARMDDGAGASKKL